MKDITKVLENLVAECPIHLSCDDFHHSKEDRHDVGEPCPVLNRYSEALIKAEKLLENRIEVIPTPSIRERGTVHPKEIVGKVEHFGDKGGINGK